MTLHPLAPRSAKERKRPFKTKRDLVVKVFGPRYRTDGNLVYDGDMLVASLWALTPDEINDCVMIDFHIERFFMHVSADPTVVDTLPNFMVHMEEMALKGRLYAQQRPG
jgi:hypothetical protein